jgi:8-oxo-dGTP diphosphatase
MKTQEKNTKEVALIVEAIIKNKKGKILLLKRSNSNKFFREKWQLPGGKVDFGENVRDAIVREIKEETTCDSKKIDIKKVFSFSEKFNGFSGTVFLMIFDADVCEESEIVLSEDHTEFGFFDIQEIEKLYLTPISKKSIFGKSNN